MYPKKDNTLSLIGGAVLGAVAMYLLDPESGRRRRENLAEATGEFYDDASGRIAPLMERVSDTAKNVGSSLAGHASAFGGTVSDKYGELRESHPVQHAGDHVSDFASRLVEKLKSAGTSAKKSARSAAASASDAMPEMPSPRDWFRPKEESHLGTYAATGVGTLVLGAGLMYLLDPQRGKTRRARIVDQAASIVRQTGRTASRLGREIGNRATGRAHEAKAWATSAMTDDAVSAERLLQRVRSEMGHAVSHAGVIQVMTDNHGRVTLHGKVLRSESEKLLATINGVTGVTEVINLLSVKDTEQQMHEPDAVSTSSGTTAPQL
jgi:gas vesicle protein